MFGILLFFLLLLAGALIYWCYELGQKGFQEDDTFSIITIVFILILSVSIILLTFPVIIELFFKISIEVSEIKKGVSGKIVKVSKFTDNNSDLQINNM